MHDFFVSLDIRRGIGSNCRLEEKWREINWTLRMIDRGSMCKLCESLKNWKTSEKAQAQSKCFCSNDCIHLQVNASHTFL